MLAIGFDADDTLWHNESLFSLTQEKYRELLAPYHSAEWIDRKLFETESRNLAHFGYGIKGFTLSMIETAIELTEGRITGAEIGQIIGLGRAMLQAPVELLPGASEVVPALAEAHSLLLITKGDLFDQESKVARSGLGDYFSRVEIVREKDPGVYATILARHGIEPSQFLMVGNSLRSDILPVLSIGGHAAYVPYAITWQHEQAELPEPDTPGFYALASLHDLPALVEQLSAERTPQL
ncbi:MAG TPA: HAD family hydrolase [Caldilineaceae bacterium]|nr:HAD family hydrolase [Caldilineaceae bacterium]